MRVCACVCACVRAYACFLACAYVHAFVCVCVKILLLHNNLLTLLTAGHNNLSKPHVTLSSKSCSPAVAFLTPRKLVIFYTQTAPFYSKLSVSRRRRVDSLTTRGDWHVQSCCCWGNPFAQTSPKCSQNSGTFFWPISSTCAIPPLSSNYSAPIPRQKQTGPAI